MDKKILITNDEIDYSTSTVTHIKLNDFLNIDSLDEIQTIIVRLQKVLKLHSFANTFAKLYKTIIL